MNQKFVIDRSVTMAGSSRELTPEGFLRVKGRVARTGIQDYLAHELGIMDGDPNRMVKVYRPAEEVFADASLASYAEKGVTDDHPSDLVTCDSFKLHSVGDCTDRATHDTEWVDVPMIVKHGDTIKKIVDGKAELSAGYLAEYVYEPGVTADGAPYEFVQRNIRINHVAIVDAARAGSMARIFDAAPKQITQPKGETMTRKVVLDSKRKISVTLDEDTAAVVESVISTLEEDKAEAEKREAEARAEVEKKEAQIDALQEKVDSLEGETSETAMDARVKAIIATGDTARKIVLNFDAKGETRPLEIKRSAMAAKYPSRDWAAKSVAYVEAAFDAEAEKAEEEEGEDKSTKDAHPSIKSFADDFSKSRRGLATNDGANAYADFLKGGAK